MGGVKHQGVNENIKNSIHFLVTFEIYLRGEKMRRKKILIILVLCLVFLTTGLSTFSAQGATLNPVLVGLYPNGEIYTSVSDINDYDTAFGGNVFSIAGTFLDLESPDWFILAELNTAWDNGYVPFVNLGAGGYGVTYTAQQIAEGALDSAIRHWADLYKTWSNGGSKRAFIAALQEGNGGYAAYSGDPENYKKAYLRIRQIFDEQGVPSEAISWVYAPNGWHNPGTGYPFEEGYPGDSAVDVVAFSSFNWGDCWTYTDSQDYEEIFEPYLVRMRAMAPGKPIFIAEIGSVTEGVDRAAWFTDTLTKIGNFPGVRGLLYFHRWERKVDIENEYQLCDPIDHQLSAGNNEGLAEFEAVVTQPPYGYWAPDSVEMTGIAFDRPEATFEDVWPASDWSDQPTIYYQSWVDRLAAAGVTGGCGSTVIDLGVVTDFTYRYYCPENNVTRAEMAIFLLKSKYYGQGYTPPPAVGTRFDDVIPGDGILDWADDYIEELAVEGVTGGCSADPPLYCPNARVTRAQMALFLLKAKYGSGYSVPPASGTRFDDVIPGDGILDWADDYIEELAAHGITGGCSASPPLYCPSAFVTRGQMALFLVRTFDLP